MAIKPLPVDEEKPKEEEEHDIWRGATFGADHRKALKQTQKPADHEEGRNSFPAAASPSEGERPSEPESMEAPVSHRAITEQSGRISNEGVVNNPRDMRMRLSSKDSSDSSQEMGELSENLELNRPFSMTMSSASKMENALLRD